MKLYEHQIKALEQTQNMNRVAYYLDMGLGKTFVGSVKMHELNERVNLVICQKSKIDDWFNHFSSHYSDLGYSFINLTNKLELGYFVEMANNPNATLKLVGIINYELAFRRKELLQLHDFTLMLDESSLIQNSKAKRTKFILKLNAKNVILLSGTPSSGKYENLWSQLHLLGWNIKKTTYDNQYVNWINMNFGGFIHKVVNKNNPYKNIERLKSKMREHGAVFMKTEECFDLPEQTFIDVTVQTSKEYKRFKKDSIIELEDRTLIGDTSLTKMLYSRMLCGAYNQDKLQAFQDLVESTNDRLIVFYNFYDELNQLKNIAERLERPISEVNGTIKNLNAYENENDSITFVQYQAGAMGLNLQKANKIVYFTLPLSSELFEQSKKRTHRIGQQNTCFYYQMICEHSIEQSILETLKERKDYTDELFRKEIW